MRRSLVVVVLSVFALTLLSACGDGENPTSSNPPAAPDGGSHDDHGESMMRFMIEYVSKTVRVGVWS